MEKEFYNVVYRLQQLAQLTKQEFWQKLMVRWVIIMRIWLPILRSNGINWLKNL